MRGKYFKFRDEVNLFFIKNEKNFQELKRSFVVPGRQWDKDILLTVHLMVPMNKPFESFDKIKFKVNLIFFRK